MSAFPARVGPARSSASTIPRTLVTRESTRSSADTAPAWPVRDETIALHDAALESGERLGRVDVRYRLEGTINAARDNVVLVVHALTGTTEASAWWPGVVGHGCAIDPTRHAVLCANLLGGCDGTLVQRTGDALDPPAITTRDQASVLARLLDALHIGEPLLICGGSLGGMVTLEFAASFPDRVRSAVVLAAPAAQTAQGSAWNAIMQTAIAIGGPRDGLALARMVGMLSYRTPEGLEQRFGRSRVQPTRSGVASGVVDWLQAHGERLVNRFDADSYSALIAAMDAHDTGRGRGGAESALAPVADRLTGVGIEGDLLYPAEAVRRWTRDIGARYVVIDSLHGHDAFLLETERVSAVLADALANTATVAKVRGAPLSTARRIASSAGTASPGTRSRTLRVALAGCGNVGGNLLELLGDRSERGGDGIAIQVDRVLVRDDARAHAALEKAIASGVAAHDARTVDPGDLLPDGVDVLVETIGGTSTAGDLVEEALRRGIRVVTANKALLSQRGAALAALAGSRGVRLDFEGAVCGAIPIVRCVRSGAAGVDITGVSGILNGTSNFVLERLGQGHTLAEAVAEAQRLGYAESDPTRDLSGEDAEDKLRILSWLCFGVDPSELCVTRRGIDAELARWVAQVAAEGEHVKLVGQCRREGTRLVAEVIPRRVAAADPLARVSGACNRVVVESASAGALVFQGPGAGGRATAGAVLADLLGLEGNVLHALR